MDKVKSLEDYMGNVLLSIKDQFGVLPWTGSDDYNVIKEWFEMGIEPHYVLLALSELNVKGNFRLREVGEVVKKWYRNKCREEASEAARTLKGETLPYNRIEKLAKIVKFVLVELKVSDFSLVDKMLSLRNCPNLKEIEEKLYLLEEEFYELLKKNSPKTEECKQRAKKLLLKYEFYWDEKVLKVTEKSLVKNCLRQVYGIPEFSVV